MSKERDLYIVEEEMDILNKEANENAAQDYIRVRTGAEDILDSRFTK